MRANFDKKHFTKPERIFGEILKKNRIPFRSKVLIGGREADFVLGNIAVEIGDHSQNRGKNRTVIEEGYSLMFITNKELYEDRDSVEQHLLNYWLRK